MPAGVSIFSGANAQGKSNLLEALYLLSTGRSSRAGLEREMVHWGSLREELPFARVEATVHRQRGDLRLEVVLQVSRNRGTSGEEELPSEGGPMLATTQKQVKLNGLPRRLAELVGEMNVVLFDVESIRAVSGSPSDRRRYLDTLQSQVSRPYVHQLAHYTRVLAQRNRLLKRIKEKESTQEELPFWDQELASAGAFLNLQRLECLRILSPLAREVHFTLTDGQERLEVRYLPSLDCGIQGNNQEALAGEFHRRLVAERRRELAAGMTLVGPHRDDLGFLVNGVDAGVYGSRGQHRTIALALKLAEANFIENRTGELPVLLLDDILAELDASRRQQLLVAVPQYPQSIITTTELDLFDRGFLEMATLYRVHGGRVEGS